MNNFRLSAIFSGLAMALITVVFLAVISPWKGLGIATPYMIMSGIGSWFAGILFFISAVVRKHHKTNPKSYLFLSILFLLIFIPVGYSYMYMSGRVRTKITVRLTNKSGSTLEDVVVYGSGPLFIGQDTLWLARFENEQEVKFKIWPDTKPQKGGGKKGNVELQYTLNGEQNSKTIAGEFSVYPSHIQQKWDVTIDPGFLKNN